MSNRENILKDGQSEEEVVDTATASEGKEWTITGTFTLIAFIAMLVVPYIYLSHRSDEKVRKMDKLTKEVKELRAEYITLKSEIVSTNKQTDVAERLKEDNIKILDQAPYKITEE